MAAEVHGMSATAVFFDLAAAFEKVAREIIMGGRLDPAKLGGNVSRLGLEAGVIAAAQAFVAGGDFLQRAGVPEEVAALARMVHDSKWFAMSGCQAVVATPAGTRAGNPLGDLLFNLAFASLLRIVRARLEPAGLVVRLPDVPRSCLLLASHAAAGGGTTCSDGAHLDGSTFCLWD